MDLRVFVEPQQGASYLQQLTVAQTAEELGFDAFFRSDHFLKMGDASGLPGPTDAWVTLGAIARETLTIRLGTLVTSATFRLPGPLAISVAQVDDMSGGRVELGLGAGWYGDEHTAYGIPFPSVKERFDRLEEQLEIITGLWHTPADSQYTFEGEHYGLVGSPALPKPLQPGGPPVIIGGHGPTRTPRLAAQYANEFNLPFAPVETFTTQRDRVRKACEERDRDPATMTFSAALVLCCGENDAEVERRAGVIGRAADELRENGAAGTPAEVLDKIATYAEAGAERIYLQVLDMDDLDHLRLVADQVMKLLP
jgi:F420-dependent oxidoreductase-like protein